MRVVVTIAGRVDRALADAWAGAGRARVARAFEDGRVRVNGRRARKGDRVLPDDVVEIAGELIETALVPEPGPLVILHQDDALVALDKPAGMPSHPLRPGETGTLANRLVAVFPECGAAGADPREAGLVQRLDAGTSGVIVAARGRAAWDSLRAAFGERRVKKEYLALVVGQVTRAGEVDAPLAQVDGGRTAMVCPDPDEAARRHARPARTTWEPALRLGDFTLVRCHAETGRMHQIRAHLAHAGIPIVGDARYGIAVAGAPALPAGFFLHAAAVELDHPTTGERLRLEAPLPATWPPAAGLR